MAAPGLCKGADADDTVSYTWCDLQEDGTSTETALENKEPVVAAASTGDQTQVPQVEALDAGDAEALDPPVAANAKQLQPVMETVGSVVKELEDQPLQHVAVMAETKATAEIAERDGVSMPGHPVIQSDNTTSQAKNSAQAGMEPVVAASAPSGNPCSIVSSVPKNSLWWQPIWMQMESLQEGHVPGLTIGADPKELYICFM